MIGSDRNKAPGNIAGEYALLLPSNFASKLLSPLPFQNCFQPVAGLVRQVGSPERAT